MVSFFSDLFGRSRASRKQPHTDWMPFIAAPHGESKVVLASLDISARITGLYAETTQTMRFDNLNHRDLEGSLTFPLPDGAVVCGYALDVDGEMVDGVVVRKHEARRILEAEERKGVDPGLLEKVQGNVYRTRIHPIPARGSRTVRITYVTELTVKDASAAYHLPLGHVQYIERVHLRLEVAQVPVEPEISGNVGNLTLERWKGPGKVGPGKANSGNNWLAQATLPKGLAAEDLQVKLPDLPDHFASLEETDDGEVFFCISEKLPDVTTSEQAAWRPERMAVAWDASGSRTDTSRDIAFLRELLATWSDLMIDLVVFRDREHAAPTPFEVRGGRAEALFAYLEQLDYDGATNLADLDLAQTPHIDDEAWLLFSDGLGTLASGLPELGDIPVFTINSAAQNHSEFLQYVAQETGGRYVNLLRTKAGGSYAMAIDAVVQLRDPSWRIAQARGCADLHKDSGHGRMVVLGRMTGTDAVVELTGADANAGATQLRFAMRADDASWGHNIARVWAGFQATRVHLEDGEVSRTLEDLGRRYGLVTPGTSLLVLESLEQYLEYDIEPPASLPKLRKAFHSERDVRGNKDHKREQKQLDDVLRMWRDRVSWWETDFRPRWSRRDNVKSKVGMSNLRSHRAPATAQSVMAPPMPAPSMPPAPMPAAPEPASMMLAEESMDDMMMQRASMQVDASMDMDMEVAGMPRSDAVAVADEAPGKADKSQAAGAQASIRIQAWEPTTPYLAAMKRAPSEQAYRVYLEERARYRSSPSFYLDCGDYLLKNDLRESGLRVLSNLLEMDLADPALMRMYAWRLQQADELDLAIAILERVREERDDEPQSHRDLALALAERWQRDGRSAEQPEDVLRAMELLYHVILHPWERFPEIEIIALMELNRLIHLAEDTGVEIPERIDHRLRAHLPLDVRISMVWDADQTDVDLHVYEPNGDHGYYGNNRTTIGGLVSRDFRQGYGPEEYVLRRAMPGTYTIKAHYYGSSQQDVCGPCTVLVHVFTNYARADEAKQVLTLRLERPSDQVLVGEIEVTGSATGSATGDSSQQDKNWRQKFEKLKKGMTVSEVVALVGQPREIAGGDDLELQYEPMLGVRVMVGASPKVHYVRAYVDGARLDLL